MVAVNDWLSGYHVRTGGVLVMAGTSVVLRIEPTKRITTEAFGALPIEVRKCRFPDETVRN